MKHPAIDSRGAVVAWIEAGGKGTSAEISQDVGLSKDTVRKVLYRLRAERVADVVDQRPIIDSIGRAVCRADVWAKWQRQERPGMGIVQRALCARDPLHMAWWPMTPNAMANGVHQ